jgi:UDP:flavonoid glycosyltransferase YjiC (YdhE family)
MKKPNTKPVILFFPFDLLSHYTRSIQLAKSIQDKFEIHFSASGKYNNLVVSNGFKIFDCEIFDPKQVLEDSGKFKFSWLLYENLKRVFQSQVKIIKKLNPAIVFGDTAPTLKMSAEITGTKYVSIMNGYMSKYYALTRNISKDHPAAKFQYDLPKTLFDKMIRTGEQVAFHLIQRSFNKLRKEYNLNKQNMYLDELEGYYNLICDDAGIFPQKNLPQNYKIIGPLYYKSDKKEPEIIKIFKNDKLNILANVGSSGDLQLFSFLNNEYFQDFNIIVTGEKSTILKGKNIFNRKFINNSAILEKIDLVLSHGGNGIIYQSLAYGVPLICGTSIFEQEWNVQRIEELGYGKSIDGFVGDNEKINIVKQWIGKKGTEKFKNIKKRINVDESISNFKIFIDENFK